MDIKKFTARLTKVVFMKLSRTDRLHNFVIGVAVKDGFHWGCVASCLLGPVIGDVVAWTTCCWPVSIWQTTSSLSTRKVQTLERKTRCRTVTPSLLCSLSSGNSLLNETYPTVVEYVASITLVSKIQFHFHGRNTVLNCHNVDRFCCFWDTWDMFQRFDFWFYLLMHTHILDTYARCHVTA